MPLSDLAFIVGARMPPDGGPDDPFDARNGAGSGTLHIFRPMATLIHPQLLLPTYGRVTNVTVEVLLLLLLLPRDVVLTTRNLSHHLPLSIG
jgi:hypothetical protein